jgi:hypothetical protein
MTSLKDNNLGVFFTAQIHLESKVKCNLYLKSEDIYTNKQAMVDSLLATRLFLCSVLIFMLLFMSFLCLNFIYFTSRLFSAAFVYLCECVFTIFYCPNSSRK